MISGSDYLLWGSAGHAKVLDEAIRLNGGKVVALVDNDANATPALPDVPLLLGLTGLDSWMADQSRTLCALVAIGGARGRDRLAIQAELDVRGIARPVLVHPRAWVADTARLGRGTQVLANAIVAAGARVGDACIINHGAQVDHECRLGDGVHIAPGATLCGLVDIGDGAMVGAGAVVLPRVKIGADSIVGAGAVVTCDVPPKATVYGTPARIADRRPAR